MTIGTPTSIASGSNSTLSGSKSTTVIAPAGSLIFLVFSCNTAAETITAVADANGNTYTAGTINSTGKFHQAFWTITSSALASGAAITWTQSTTASVRFQALYCTGITGTTPLDQQVLGNGTGTSPSVTTGTLATSTELLIGFCDYTAIAGNLTPESSGFTVLLETGGSAVSHTAYQVVGATTAVTYNPTLTSSVAYVVAAYAFKGSSSGSPWSFAGNTVGRATTTGAVGRKAPLAGNTVGLASTTLSDSAKRPLAGSSAGQATATGAVSRKTQLAGSSAGASTTSGALVRRAPMAGTSVGHATTTAAVGHTAPLAGATHGIATATGADNARRPLAGLSTGQANTSGDLQKSGSAAEADMWLINRRRRR